MSALLASGDIGQAPFARGLSLLAPVSFLRQYQVQERTAAAVSG
jgi:hypothetical protein